MTRAAYTCASLVAVGVLGGCSQLGPARDKAQHADQWSAVRARVRFQLAHEQFQSRHFEETCRTVTESLALDPTQPDAYALLARANLELGQTASAREALTLASRLRLESGELLYLEGLLLEQEDQLEAALEKYSAARQRDPRSVDAFVAHVECLADLGRASEALVFVEQEFANFDDVGTIAVLGGHLAALLGRGDDAVRWYRRAVRAGVDDTLVIRELGLLLAERGECTEALRLLEASAASTAAEVGAPVRLAIACCRMKGGEYAQAVASLAPYVRENPTDLPAARALAEAALSTGDVLTALAALDRGSSTAPDEPLTLLLRAIAQWRRGDFATARRVLEQLLERQPDDLEALCLMGEVHLAQREPGRAADLFDKALDLDPYSSWARAGRAAAGSQLEPAIQP